ncbi:Uma2 family endonuclease [Lyngbya confervoides]|uniref:Uma2 family endonuclease n=1 Tax=Lyngbya confervoides BDU141951 TaxID=1574623 RepID=A0ABD4SYJ2_9CYAN|nr:Uma2 family endonuclease [Lyngbya confervoides]MCM1981236.1 Uma2 family endonuclease [Lyngbya confervoides BDU141951]
MTAQTLPPPISPEDYLALEEKSEIKHEYIDGQIYAMAGTTDDHNILVGNLYTNLRNHLRGQPCRTYFTDIKIRLEQRNRFYYPDLFVTCDPRDSETSTYKQYPKLIIEVLSDSTEAFDRGDKFNDYQTLPSLEEYSLVNTKQQRIETFRRQPNGLWLLQTYTPKAILEFQSICLNIHLSDIYTDIDLDRNLN